MENDKYDEQIKKARKALSLWIIYFQKKKTIMIFVIFRLNWIKFEYWI